MGLNLKAPAPREAKKWGIRLSIGGAIVAIVGFALYTVATLSFSYSKGERVGFVQKISKRGWVCKTNEGELAMVNMAGQQAEMFYFTVRDDTVAKEDRVARRSPESRWSTRSTRGPLQLLRGHKVLRGRRDEGGLGALRPKRTKPQAETTPCARPRA